MVGLEEYFKDDYPLDEEYEEDEELLDKLKTTKERVEWLLYKYPNARNSDLYLTILYLRKFTELGKYIKYIPYNVIKRYDGIFETVRRCRQYVQNTLGKYPPTDEEVLRKRRKKARKYRKLINEL